MSSTSVVRIPQPTQPILQIGWQSGGQAIVDRSWFRFFAALGSGTTGVPSQEVVVNPTGSPFVYSATAFGWLLISGGGISNVTVTRGGGPTRSTGTFRGMFPMSPGDFIQVTYQTAPQMAFYPG